MNERYKLIFYMIGISDSSVDKLSDKEFDISRKGDFYNHKLKKEYVENIARKIIFTTYEEGFPPIVEEMISFIKNNELINDIIIDSKRISLQTCVYIFNEGKVPYIHFTPEQMNFFSKINCALDFYIGS